MSEMPETNKLLKEQLRTHTKNWLVFETSPYENFQHCKKPYESRQKLNL